MAGKDFDTGEIFRDSDGKIHILSKSQTVSGISTTQIRSIDSLIAKSDIILGKGISFNEGTGPSGGTLAGEGFFVPKMIIAEQTNTSTIARFSPQGPNTSSQSSNNTVTTDPRIEFIVGFTADSFSGASHITAGLGFSFEEPVESYIGGSTFTGRVAFAYNATAGATLHFGLLGAVVGLYNCGPTFATGGATGPCGGASGETGPLIRGLSSGAVGYPYFVQTKMNPDKIRDLLLNTNSKLGGFTSSVNHLLKEEFFLKFGSLVGSGGITFRRSDFGDQILGRYQQVVSNHEFYASDDPPFIGTVTVADAAGATYALSATANASGGDTGGPHRGEFQDLYSIFEAEIRSEGVSLGRITEDLNALDSVHKLMFAGLTN